MKTYMKSFAIFIIVIACVGLVFWGDTSARSKDPKMGSSGLWLSHFLGEQVNVYFISPVPDIGRTLNAKLMDVEYPGIVLKIGDEEIFFSYANIISVEPLPK